MLEKEYAASFGIEGDYGGSSAKLEMSVTKNSKESTHSHIIMIEQIFSGYEVYIAVQNSTLSLQKIFKKDLNGAMEPDDLFTKYGTHWIKSIQLGGRLIVIYSSDYTEKEGLDVFSAKAKAKYQGMGGSVSGEASLTSSAFKQSELEEINEEVNALGGTPKYQMPLEFNTRTLSDFKNWATSVEETPTFACITAIEPIWNLCKDDNRKKQLEDAYKVQFTKSSLEHLKLFKQTSDETLNTLLETLTVPDKYKILSGGAKIEPKTGQSGQLLTGSYPNGTSQWRATAKAHFYDSTNAITISVIAVYDPFDLLDVIVKPASSQKPNNLPSETVMLESGYTLVGGGAKIAWNGWGNLLTNSYPYKEGNQVGWMASGKAHGKDDFSTITVYAIGIKSGKDFPDITFESKIFEETSAPAPHPTTKMSPTDTHGKDYKLVGGGAKANWKGFGSLLTASYTDDLESWKVQSQDHGHNYDETCSITAYAIGLLIIKST